MLKHFLLGIMIVLLVGCGERKEAAQVLDGFLEAIHLGQYEQAYGMLAADDQKEMSEYAYVAELSKFQRNIRNPSLAKTNFSIKGIKKAQGDKGRMIANVSLEMPNMVVVQAMVRVRAQSDPKMIPHGSGYTYYAQETDRAIYQREYKEAFEKHMAAILDGGGYPTAKVERTYYLVKEGEQWKVLINLKTGGSLW